MRHRKCLVQPFGLIRILALLARLQSVLVVQPNLPQAVYVAMVREKDWIPRRERLGHVAGAASDPDMEMIVWPDFQVAWLVRPRVRRDFAAPELTERLRRDKFAFLVVSEQSLANR